MNDPLSTVQISVPTKEKLRALAEHYRRSMAGQIEWMIEQAYNELYERQDSEKSKDLIAESF